MASNKLKNLLVHQEYWRKQGVQNLITGGVPNVLLNSTIPEIVSRMPEMTVSTPPSPEPAWTFDPLIKWNGENIDQMWDSDPRKGDWTYRYFAVINGAFDRQNFKANSATVAQRNALAFETSDGAWYAPSTDAELWHEWDKSYDIYDSKGIPVRWVKVYSNTLINAANTPYFNDAIRYVIYDMATNINSRFMSSTTLGYANSQKVLEYFRADHIIATSQSVNIPILSYLPSLKKVHLPALETISNLALIFIPLLQSVSLPALTTISGSTLSYCDSLQSVSLPALTTISGSSSTLSNNSSLQSVSLPALTTISSSSSSSTLSNNSSLQSVSLPALTTISGSSSSSTLYNNSSLQSVSLPALTTISGSGSSNRTLYNNSSLQSVSLPVSLINYVNLTLTDNYALQELNIPFNWNKNIAIAQSTMMTREALLSIIDNMADMTGKTAIVLSMGAINLGKLSAADKLIATNKNITLS